MIRSSAMDKKGFTLIELLIVVAILAALVGAAMPFYQNYMKETRVAKAKHELDIIKDALVKHDTFEDKKFSGEVLDVLLGKYLQELHADPWGRQYQVDAGKGQVKSLGPDHIDPRDDLIVDYKPPLVLQKAVWVDSNNDARVTASDIVRLEFSKYLVPGNPINMGIDPNGAIDLCFSPEVRVSDLIATITPSSATEVLLYVNAIPAGSPDSFYPGSSTVRVASGNVNLYDIASRPANGTYGAFKGMEVVIKSE